ncbi:MAG TPA: hypothetical protein VFD35_12220 [Pricia sp.]|nr:hypothetical protein [Pricia sp.]
MPDKWEYPWYPKKVFSRDENFKNEHFFYEFFDGDTGKGLGASHQDGWTALIANLIMDMEADKTDKKMDDRQIENVLAESR